MKPYSQSGFTLLEVLIAVTITAIIGVGASQILSSASDTRFALEQRSNEIKNLQRLDMFLRKDFSQVVGRQAKNTYGELTPAIHNQGDYLVEFSYSGVPIQAFNPDSKQSNILRGGYAIRTHDHDFCKDAELPENPRGGNCLVRLHWPVLDATSDTEPVVQVLIDDITEANFYFIGNELDQEEPSNSIRSSDPREEWPPYLSDENMIADLIFVSMKIKTPSYDEIERIFEVPRYAFSK